MKQWFVGMTKDQQESLAAKNLREQGFIVYLPRLYSRVQEGKKIWARADLRFTGYIFIQFDASQDEHSPINNTRGMDELLCLRRQDGFGQEKLSPIPLPPGIIETLRQLEDEEFALAKARKKPAPRKDLIPGDLVQIAGDRSHPAYGHRGHYLGSEKGWASVLGGIAVWKVPEIDLKKIEQQERKAA